MDVYAQGEANVYRESLTCCRRDHAPSYVVSLRSAFPIARASTSLIDATMQITLTQNLRENFPHNLRVPGQTKLRACKICSCAGLHSRPDEVQGEARAMIRLTL